MRNNSRISIDQGIGRRAMLKAALAGGAALLAHLTGTTLAIARDAAPPTPPGQNQLPKMTKETVLSVAHHLYGYELSHRDAAAIAGTADSILANLGYLNLLKLSDVQPPFGYSILAVEASRLKK